MIPFFNGLAPRVGLEPTTPRLTAECSTIELSRMMLFAMQIASVEEFKAFWNPSQHRSPAKSRSYYTFKTEYWNSLFSILPSISLTAFAVFLFGQAFDRLVTFSYIHCCTYTYVLSTLYSSRGLMLYARISHLEGGFTLRCLQRLSLPDLATLL